MGGHYVERKGGTLPSEMFQKLSVRPGFGIGLDVCWLKKEDE